MSIKDEQSMPKWLQKTLQDSNLSAPLLGRTRSTSYHASSDYVDVTLSVVACNEESLAFEDACGDSNQMRTMQLELDSIHENYTWELCELSKGKNAIGMKWVYKIKRKPNGSIDSYKARLVAKSYAQQYVIDYEENFAPTLRMTTICTMIALAAHRNWEMHQTKYKNNFLEW